MHERMLDKTKQPSDEEILQHIGTPFSEAWIDLRNFLAETYAIEPVYNAGGLKYGWNLQYRIAGRPLCEMYPERGSFTVLVILGRAELDQALSRLESFGGLVRGALVDTPRFHDGCWMYIRVADQDTYLQDGQDIQQLIQIKRKAKQKKVGVSDHTAEGGGKSV